MREEPIVHVYCVATHITDGDLGGPVKIGFSENPYARVVSLKTGSPKKLGLAGAISVFGRRTAAMLERAAHEKFADKRLHGEWFDTGPLNVLEYLTDLYCQILHNAVANGKIEQSDFDYHMWRSGVTPVRETIAKVKYLQAWSELAV